jgi:hypothetical protein
MLSDYHQKLLLNQEILEEIVILEQGFCGSVCSFVTYFFVLLIEAFNLFSSL